MKRLNMKIVTLTGMLLISMGLVACQSGPTGEEAVEAQPTSTAFTQAEATEQPEITETETLPPTPAEEETAAEQIERLRTLLAERPETITEPVPFLPPANANQLLWTRAMYLDFQTGTGIRYLTQHAQAVVPVNNQELIYTFQGLTNDEAYYLSAVFPVNHPDLPLNAGNIPADFEETFDEYLAGIIEQLDEAEAASFTPDLALLDAFIQSIAVESDTIPSDVSLEGEYPAAVSAAVELFSQNTGISESAIEIVSVSEKEGCYEPL